MKKKLIALILCLALALASLAAIPAPGIDTDESAVMFNVAEEVMEEETGETEEPTPTEEPGEDEGEFCDLSDVVSVSDVAPFLPAVKAAAPSLRSIPRANSALFADENGEEENGLILNKWAQANTDGTYTITLESYVTGKVTISTEEEAVPADIVLVLDVSGSMGDYITVGSKSDTSELDTVYGAAEGIYQYNSYGNTYVDMRYYGGKWQYNGLGGWKDLSESGYGGQTIQVSKMNALKIAVQRFVDQVYEKSLGTDGVAGTDDDVDHRIAVVKFAGTKRDTVGNETYISGSYTYNYSQIVKELISAQSNSETLKNSVVSLQEGGATSADYGMQHAQTVINGIESSRESNRVVIMFTDGEPNHWSGFDSTVANSTISASHDIKAAGASVYTVGMFSGADDTVPMPSNASNFNKYMHYVSSNFTNATSLTDGGEATYPATEGESYYLAASNAGALNNIFSTISQNIETGGASMTLGVETAVKDVVSPYFQMPESADSISVSTADYQGYNEDGTRKFSESTPYSSATVTIDPETSSVSVSNFDFSGDENCVTDKEVNGVTTYSGKKLIISFTVTPKETFLGGNNVPTNGTASGIYTGNAEIDPIETFPVPTTNVPIKDISVTATDKNVYLTGGLTETDMVNGATASVGNVALNLGADNYGLETWQNKFVTISVTAGGSQTAYMTDSTYSVSVTVSPSEALESSVGTPAGAKTGTATANINVFLPTVGFSDDAAYYGDNVPDLTDNAGTVTWKHNGTDSSTVTMIGTAPELTYTYAPGNGVTEGKIATKSDIPVNVTAKIGDTDITEHVTFTHQDYSEGETIPENAEFVIHVRTCQLTVTKSGGDESETYVFTVMKDGTAYTSVTITGNNSVTIVELPVGNYSVTEDTGWSWRYKATIDGPATLSSANSSGTITCTNAKTNDNWLNGFSAVVKNIFGAKTN